MPTEFVVGAAVIKIIYNAVADVWNFIISPEGMLFVLAALMISMVLAPGGRVILNTLAAIMVLVAATSPNHQWEDVVDKCIFLFLGAGFFYNSMATEGNNENE